MMNTFTASTNVNVLDLISREFKLGLDNRMVCVAGRQGMENVITRTINRPGLALNGKFVGFGEDRIQLFGRGEVEFLRELEKENRLEDILDQLFEHSLACCIVSHAADNIPPKVFADYCEKNNCPLFYSELSSADLSTNIFRILNDLFSPQELKHGVFMEVHDLGVFITGDSGIGKSEIALELIEKNRYRLIADDVVLMKKVDKNTIIGTSYGLKQYQHNIEIRGLGLVNVAQIYGIGTTLNAKKVHMVVELKHWNDEEVSNIDRLDNEQTTDILGVNLPYTRLHVKAGRNVSLLIETAAIKHRLVTMGYHGKENPYLW